MDEKCYKLCMVWLRSAKTQLQIVASEMDRRKPNEDYMIEAIDVALSDLEAMRRSFLEEKQSREVEIPKPKQIKLYQVKGHKSPNPAPIFETKEAAEAFQKEFGGEIESA